VIKPGGADAAMLSTISALAVDATGTLYAVDATYHRAFKIAADGSVTRLAGAGGTATPFGEQPAGTPGFQDGADKEALFNEPAGLIVDTSGNLLIADRKNHAIRRMTPTGIVTTVAGGPARDKPTGDFVDGPVATARFNAPQGLALDGSGNLFIADTVNHRLRMLTPDGRVQTLAGTGAPGDANGPGTVAAFELPRFVATGPMGKVFVAEKARVRLVKLAP
jgi:sugar lactone lactonase YvrE